MLFRSAKVLQFLTVEEKKTLKNLKTTVFY